MTPALRSKTPTKTASLNRSREVTDAGAVCAGPNGLVAANALADASLAERMDRMGGAGERMAP